MTIQAVLAVIIVLTGTFNTVITYTTFSMTLFSTLTVIGVMILRKKNPGLQRPYKTWGYPVTPLLFIFANAWFMYFLLTNKFPEAAIGLGIIAVGFVVYLILPKK